MIGHWRQNARGDSAPKIANRPRRPHQCAVRRHVWAIPLLGDRALYCFNCDRELPFSELFMEPYKARAIVRARFTHHDDGRLFQDRLLDAMDASIVEDAA